MHAHTLAMHDLNKINDHLKTDHDEIRKGVQFFFQHLSQHTL